MTVQFKAMDKYKTIDWFWWRSYTIYSSEYVSL